MVTPAPPTAEVQLEATARIGTELTIAYRVTNGSAVDVALCNRLFERDVDGGLRFDPGFCFVDIEQRTLHVAQMLLPVPDDLSVAETVVPGTTVVPAGESVDHRISLPIPVEACNPHRRVWLAMQGRPRQPIGLVAERQIDVVVLAIGYVSLSEEATVQPFAGAPPDVMRLHCADPQARQQTLESNLRLDESVAALDYGPVPPPSPTPSTPQPEAP